MTIVLPVSDNSPGPGTSWRELAVARSLDSARSRAETRVQRFLDSAMELMKASEGREFTVQEVVEHSGQSSRSFYQYFGGKHELLLALFEESIRATAEQLRTLVDEESDPGERVHRFVVEYHQMCRPAPKRSKAKTSEPSQPLLLSEFAQQLLTSHPTEAAQAFVPIVELFDGLLGAAMTAGVIRGELDSSHVAGVILESVMFNAFSATIAGTSVPKNSAEAAEQLWDLVFGGLATRPRSGRGAR